MHLVDESGLQVLPDRRCSSAQPDVFATSGLSGQPQRVVNVVDKSKLGSTLHHDGRPGVMREHEDGNVVWRVVSPPASPRVIAPGSPHGSEHVAPEDPCADALET